MSTNERAPDNSARARRYVRHADLERAGESSPFRSKCPECTSGILLVRRDQDSCALIREDRCIACGQAFTYLDNAIAGVAMAPPRNEERSQ